MDAQQTSTSFTFLQALGSFEPPGSSEMEDTKEGTDSSAKLQNKGANMESLAWFSWTEGLRFGQTM